MKEALLKDFHPKPNLQQYVRKYQVFRFVFEKDTEPPPKFYTPRPEHCITFYVRDFQRFSYFGTKEIITYPKCVINGMYNMPIYRYGGQDFWAIKVVLQPAALYHLIGIHVQKLTNTFLDAEDVWGNNVRLICEQLNCSTDLNEMLNLIETFMEELVDKSMKPLHPIDKACQYMLQWEDPISLDLIADQSCLSVRQFIRKFEERIGINPKMFNRIIRFDRAFRMKNNQPHLDWLYIAIATGYYDYQHLVKDFKAFTNLTPTAFYDCEKKAPERSFGLHEC
jgi:AraC-like DNA-binding protein